MQLLMLRASDCPQLDSWIKERKYFSPTILNEQISLMGLQLLRSLLDDIKQAQFFSLIADEATDESKKEQLTVCIRWVDDEFTIHEDPLELIHVPKCDSDTLTSTIKDSLIRLCLPISQCHGQAYDGASTMSGHLNNVASQIEADVPAAIFFHCFAHCMNLCLQTVGRRCAPIRDALDLVMEITQLIQYSPKRSTLFSNLQRQLTSGSKTLKPLCPTRWTVRTSAISAVLSNYSVLCVALEKINVETSDDYGRKAGGFLAIMEKFSTFFSLKLSHLIFSGTEQLSLTHQYKDITIQEATMAAEVAVQYLIRQRTDAQFEYFYTSVVKEGEKLSLVPVLPRYRQPPRRPGDDGVAGHRFVTPEDYFRKEYFEVLDLLVNELKRRFQQKRGLPVVAVVERLLLEAANGTLNVCDQIPEELQLYKSDINLERMKTQLLMLPDLIRTRNTKLDNTVPIKKVTNIVTLCDIMNEITVSKDMLSEVFRLLKIFLSASYYIYCRMNLLCTPPPEDLLTFYNGTGKT